MKIILDTKEESLQDLQDTMRMLQALIQSRGGISNMKNVDIFSSASSILPTPGIAQQPSGLMSMFDISTAEASLGTGNSVSSIDQSGEKIPEVQIIEY